MLNHTMTILLGIICQHPVNAYELNKRLSQMNVRRWYEIASSTVYASLKTAEKKGYISGRIEKEGNMPDKTVYSITPQGKGELEKALAQDIRSFSYDITPFHIGIFFFSLLKKEERISLMEERIQLLRKYREGIAQQLDHMEKQEVPRLFLLNAKQCFGIVEAQEKGAAEILEEIRKSADER